MDGLSKVERTIQFQLVKIVLDDPIKIGGKSNGVDFRRIAIVIGIEDRLTKGARPAFVLARDGERCQYQTILHRLDAKRSMACVSTTDIAFVGTPEKIKRLFKHAEHGGFSQADVGA